MYYKNIEIIGEKVLFWNLSQFSILIIFSPIFLIIILALHLILCIHDNCSVSIITTEKKILKILCKYYTILNKKCYENMKIIGFRREVNFILFDCIMILKIYAVWFDDVSSIEMSDASKILNRNIAILPFYHITLILIENTLLYY